MEQMLGKRRSYGGRTCGRESYGQWERRNLRQGRQKV